MADLENREGEIMSGEETPETITMYGPVGETADPSSEGTGSEAATPSENVPAAEATVTTDREKSDRSSSSASKTADSQNTTPGRGESLPPPKPPERFIDKLPGMHPVLRVAVRLGATLLAIAVTVGLLLAIVNAFTQEKIRVENERAIAEGMAAVLPGADQFETIDYTSPDGIVTGISRGLKEGQPFGYAVTASPSGYGGAIDMIVGIGADGAVTGVTIVSLSETPGLGSHGQDPAFLNQFIGKSGAVEVTKTGEEGKINAISGATITSRAVTSGVNASLAAAAEVQSSGK